MLYVVEFTSLSDENKKYIKDYEENLLRHQIPEWCDVIRIGTGKFIIPKDQAGYAGEYKLVELRETKYVCDKVESDKPQGLFRDGKIYDIEENCELICPANLKEYQEKMQRYDDEFYEEYPELPQYDY